MKKVYQQVEMILSTYDELDVMSASTLGGSSGEAGDLEWLTGGSVQ